MKTLFSPKTIAAAVIAVLLFLGAGSQPLLARAAQSQETVAQESTQEEKKELTITVREDIPAEDIQDNEVPLAAFPGQEKEEGMGALIRDILPWIICMIILLIILKKYTRYRREKIILSDVLQADDETALQGKDRNS